MNPPDAIVGVGPRAPPDDNPVYSEAEGGPLDLSSITVTAFLSSFPPPPDGVSPQRYKIMAQQEILSGRASCVSVTLLDMVNGTVPANMIGYIPAEGQQKWKKSDYVPRRVVILDMDRQSFPDTAYFCEHNSPLTPVLVYRSAGGAGVHAVFVVEEPLRTAEEAAQAARRIAHLTGLPADEAAHSNQLRYYNPKNQHAVITAPSAVSTHMLNLHECRKKKVKKAVEPQAASEFIPNPGYEEKMLVLNLIFEEYMRTMDPEWGKLGYIVKLDPSTYPQLIVSSPLEKTRYGFRLSSSGELWHFGGQWGKRLMDPKVHDSKFAGEWIRGMIEIIRVAQSKAVRLLHLLQEVHVLGGQVASWEILQHSPKRELFQALGWKYNGPSDIQDPLGRRYLSATQAIGHHKKMTSGGLLPGCLVPMKLVKRYVGTLLNRLGRARAYGNRLAMKALRVLEGKSAEGKRRIGIKTTPLQGETEGTPCQSDAPRANQPTGPPGSSRYLTGTLPIAISSS